MQDARKDRGKSHLFGIARTLRASRSFSEAGAWKSVTKIWRERKVESRIAKLLSEARSFTEAGDWKRVVQICQEVIRERPNYQSFRMGAGALLKLGEAQAAEGSLLEGIKHFPDKPRLQQLLALAYAQQNKGREALNSWQTALAMDPSNEAFAAFARAVNQFDFFPEAEEVLDAALARDPRNVTLLQVRATLAERAYSIWRDRKEPFDRVKESWALIAAAEPTNPVAKVVNALLSEGHDAALAAWHIIRANSESDASTNIEIAGQLLKVLKGLDSPDLTVAICESDDFVSRHCNAGTPSMREVIRLYVQALVRQRRKTEAREVLNRSGCAISGSDTDDLFLADFDFQEREFDKALHRALSVLKRSPDSQKAHGIIVCCLSAKKHHEEAERYLDDLERRGLMDHEELGKLAEASGQVQFAEQHYIRWLEGQPGKANALKAYTGFLYRTGRWETIEALASKHALLFAEDWYLKRILDDVTALSAMVGRRLSESVDGSASNAIGTICEELLRRAPNRIRSTRNEAPKIALVVGSLAPGGAERQCQLLCQQLALARRDNRIADVKLFVANLSRVPRDSFYLRSVEDTGVAVVEYVSRRNWVRPQELFDNKEAARLASLLQPADRRRQVMQLYQHLREFDPEIIHAWQDNSIFAAGLAAAYLPKARLVGRWGSLPPTVQRVSSPVERDHAAVLRLAYQALSRTASVQYFTNSRLTADAYADWIGLSRSEVLVVQNGVDFSSLRKSDEARQRIRAELGIQPGAVVIGTAIRLGSEKRPFMWLELAERVARRRDTTEFIIVGDGPLADELEGRARRLSHAKVHLVGRQANVGDWYSAMDATLMTSSVEGLSNTVIESAYMGLPVVAYDVGGMAEAVIDQQTGFLIPENDTDAMVERLVQLINHEDMRRTMSAMAHHYARENFHPAKMAKSILAIYGSLLKS